MLGGHHLGDDGQTRLLAGLGQQLQALFLQALEAVGAGARLEGAAAQAGRSRLLDHVGDVEDLLPALDGAGPGDHADGTAADRRGPSTLTTVGSFLTSVDGHLVRRQDRDHFLHSFPCFQGLLGPVALFAQGGDDGALGADDDVAAQPELFDPLDDVVDLLLAGAGFHDDDHGTASDV